MKNIILLIIDGFRSDYIKEDIVPYLYSLSKKGLYFEKAYALAPWSPPAIKGLFTSTYPFMYDEGISISPKTITLAEVLKGNGYKTAGFTGGGWISPFFGFDKGFDCFIWSLGEDKNFSKKKIFGKIKFKINKFFPKFREVHRILYLIRNIKKGELEKDKIRLKKTLEWIEQNKQNKFFVYIHLDGLHEPYLEGASTIKLIKANYNLLKTKQELTEKEIETIKKLYNFAAKKTDNYANQFIKELTKRGLLNNTYLIICSDHGQVLYEKNTFGHPQDFYEGNILIPLMIIGPGIEPKKISKQVSLLDLAPTILDLIKIEQPAGFFGKSLFKFERKYFFSEDARGATRLFPNIENLKYDLTNQEIAVIYGNYKYINKKNGENKLFDLKNDPKEKKNIINSNKKISEKLKKLILKQLKFEEKIRNENKLAI